MKMKRRGLLVACLVACASASPAPLEAIVSKHDQVIELLLQTNANLQARVDTLEATVADLLTRRVGDADEGPTSENAKAALHRHHRGLTSLVDPIATRIDEKSVTTVALNVTNVHIAGNLYVGSFFLLLLRGGLLDVENRCAGGG